ncbi:MAG: hypothetical protein ABW199_02570, partial [Caulobacterales bacterium]
MLYLIQAQFIWLLITAVAAGVAGWAWHKWRNDAKLDELDKRRVALRRELVGLVNGSGESVAEHDRGPGMQESLNGLNEARIAELERQLEISRAAREDVAARLAETQRELERLSARENIVDVTPPQQIAASAESQMEADAARWRMRYLESRVRHLEAQAPPSISSAELERLRTDLSAAQTRIAALESDIAALGASAAQDELNKSAWKARYLGARVKYLESAENVVPPIAALAAAPEIEQEIEPANDENEQRRTWRMLYLDKRIGYLADASETRIAELTEARD